MTTQEILDFLISVALIGLVVFAINILYIASSLLLVKKNELQAKLNLQLVRIDQLPFWNTAAGRAINTGVTMAQSAVDEPTDPVITTTTDLLNNVLALGAMFLPEKPEALTPDEVSESAQNLMHYVKILTNGIVDLELGDAAKRTMINEALLTAMSHQNPTPIIEPKNAVNG